MLGDLARLASPRQLRQLASGQVPGQVIIQLTDACNAHCPQCEMRVANRFDRSSLADHAIARVLDAAAARGVAAVSFTGGEPFLQFDRLVHWLGHAHKLGIPFLRTGTNGFFLRHAERPGFEQKVAEVAGRLAESGVRNVWISIDSADPAVHERMRGLPGVIDGITRALPIFEAHGLWPTANLGVNRNVGAGRCGWRPTPARRRRKSSSRKPSKRSAASSSGCSAWVSRSSTSVTR